MITKELPEGTVFIQANTVNGTHIRVFLTTDPHNQAIHLQIAPEIFLTMGPLQALLFTGAISRQATSLLVSKAENESNK